MKRCHNCNQTFSDENLFCLSDGTPLVSDTPEVPTLVRHSPFVQQPAQPARQGVSPLFAYLAIALLALVAGGAVVAYLKSDSSAQSNVSAQPKPETLATSASPTPEKQVEVKKQPETKPTPRIVVSQPSNVGSDTYNSVSNQTYRVVGVAYNDVLFVRPKPNQLKEYVGKIPPNATGVQVYGNGVRVGKNTWVNVTYNGFNGWVNSKFLAKE